MSDDEAAPVEAMAAKKGTKTSEGKVSLSQMLKALDKNVATGIEKRLKKLSKKKPVTAPLDEHKVAQMERRAAYSDVSKEIAKWDPIVERNRSARQLSFPLDLQPDLLPSTAETLEEFQPRNELERDVQDVINENKIQLQKQKELTAAERRYQDAISAEEAKDRHKELQRMRVKLSTYAAKMRMRKSIKSKSYRKLLKHERIKSHVQRVESNQDALLDEIERLQKLRAQERASLKHKNTGKWAKHAKFRAKYDEKARSEMLEQIGFARKLLEKPAVADSDESENESFDGQSSVEHEEDNGELSDVSEGDSDRENGEEDDRAAPVQEGSAAGRLIVSTELIDERAHRKGRSTTANDSNSLDSAGSDADEQDHEGAESDDDNGEQRRLMKEAFADDDIVGEFKKMKDQMANEEQPKDIDMYLPGWGDWAGPGIKTNRRKRRKYVIKAKKVHRRDGELSNVIISEAANDAIKDLQPKQLPRGFRSDKHFRNVLTKPTTSTFTNQAAHREAVRPRLETRMGQRIEPIGRNQLRGMLKAEWS